MSSDTNDADIEIEAADEPGPAPVEPAADAAEAPDAGDVAGVDAREAPRCHLIAFAAGRGGTGRSLIAANVAVYLAQTGKKVVVVDADPAGGPLHQLLGAARPTRGYGELLRGRAEGFGDLLCDTPISGVRLVGGEGSTFGSARGKPNGKGVLAAIRNVDADYVVVDLGPADSTLSIDLWLAANLPVVVTLPDPASIEATYRFVKSAFVRKLRTTRGLDRLVASSSGPPPAAVDLYRAARDNGGPADRLKDEIRAFRPRFIVNQTRTLADGKLGVWMATAAQRRLGHSFEYLGHVESDETVWLAARRRRPLLAEYPEAKVAKNIERITRRLLAAESERDRAAPPTPLRLEEEQTHYEVLETEPGVSDEEVRRAYRNLKEIYSASSPVIAGLYDEAELAVLHERANAAHDTLFSPERRRMYDLALPEADLARAVRAAAHAGRRSGLAPAGAGPSPAVDRSGPTEAPIDLGDEVTGPALRKIRESRGLDLAEISQRTKISERHLRSIEEERFGDMPAPVYVRGFVTEYARMLRIDAARAAESYLRRFRAATAGGPGGGGEATSQK
jgi:flagellar biosynthesis protein FlhG